MTKDVRILLVGERKEDVTILFKVDSNIANVVLHLVT